MEGRFVISSSPLAGEGRGERVFSYAFQLASYNPDYPLIIDPILVYSTYLGGSDSDYGNSIAVDTSGNVYVTGFTRSTDFPTASPIQGIYGGVADVFVTKINSSGSALTYSTYLGGSSNDYGYGIAVDSSGNAYATGWTNSADFPTTTPIQGSYAGDWDVFVAKINASGSLLAYSTYLGGSSDDRSFGIAVDTSGNAYVTGLTWSADFPIASPFQGSYGGIADVFVSKINASGSLLAYSTYLGGSSNDYGFGIAVDTSGNAYVTGFTISADFPTTTPIQGSHAGVGDAFATKINASGSLLVYSTYLGGSAYDEGYGIAVDTLGNAYVTGYTLSTNFPTASPIQGSLAGDRDAFVTKINASGSLLAYSTYLGGSARDRGYGIAVDGSGNAYVTGHTFSTNFPTVSPIQGNLAGGSDAFVTKINASGSLAYSTYLGGNGWENGFGIAVGSSGNAYVTGDTGSTDFPTASPIQGSSAGNFDAFVAKIGEVSAQYAFNVTKAGTGSGTITSSPAGINCGTDCYENYTANTVVTLTAKPSSGSTFAGWSGNADCSDSVVTMNANKNCTATFNTAPVLTVTKAGTGSGTVTSSPAGINCGADCSQAYTSGTSVTLTATAASDSTFAGWSGDADCSDGSVTMNVDKTCTATFNTSSSGGNTGGGSSGGGGDSGGGGGGGCGGFISNDGKNNQPPAAGMILLLLPIIWLMFRKIARVHSTQAAAVIYKSPCIPLFQRGRFFFFPLPYKTLSPLAGEGRVRGKKWII